MKITKGGKCGRSLYGINARAPVGHYQHVRLFVHDMAVDAIHIHKGRVWPGRTRHIDDFHALLVPAIERFCL